MTHTVTEKPKPLDPIWVKPSTSVPSLGGLIANAIYEHGEVILRAVGAGAVNQATKSTIKARQICLGRGDDLVVRPAMKETEGDQGDMIAVTVLRCTLQ